MIDKHPVHPRYTVSVKVDPNDRCPIQFTEDPHLPLHALAIIEWVPTPSSQPFEFVEFQWCRSDCKFPEPLMLGPSMVGLVSNRTESELGKWPYRIGVRLLDGSNKTLWSEECTNEGAKPVGFFGELKARMQRKDPPEPDVHPEVMAEAVDPGVGMAGAEPVAYLARVVSGPVIVNTGL